MASPHFSTPGGIVEEVLDLVLSTDTPGAEIRYTLNGTVPSATHGTPYAGPIRIARTSILRAAAWKPGYEESAVETHSYIFLADVINQPESPLGFPPTWPSAPADYAMDPRITQHPAYRGRMVESLRSLPSISVVTAKDHLFHPSVGIYMFPEATGPEWERPVSLEWIRPNGTREFQIDCGLRIQGGYFRHRQATQKHSLRLLFKSIYGPGKLRHDLFKEPGAAREFDTLVLRAGANDGYAWDAAIDTEQFLRDEFGRRLMLAMGQPSPRGGFVHVYLNGLYWGLYNLTERPSEDFSASYMGGAPEDWDAINAGDVKSGSLDAWNSFISGVRDVASLADYQRLKGLNPDGTRNDLFPEYFDAANYIDYMLVNIWGGNWDWPSKNYWFGRHRAELAGGFKFYIWDYENTLGNNRDRSPLHMVSPPGSGDSGVGIPHARLKSFPEYQIEFADRVQRYFFNGGLLTPESLITRYRELAQAVEPAIIAESARWGDDHWPEPQDLEDWLRERDWILQTYLPQRTGIVLDQLRSAGLFPSISAPAIHPRGGKAAPSTPIVLTANAAELFYTINGLDPRLPGGAARPEAVRVLRQSNGGPATAAVISSGPVFISAPGWVKARARQGNDWSALSEAFFYPALVAATADHLAVSELCYHPAEPVVPAERLVSSDRDEFEFIEVMNVSTQSVDLGGVRFTAGISFRFPDGATLGAGERAVVVRNRAAFQARYGSLVRMAGQYDGNLSNAGEEIELIDLAGRQICRFTYLDEAPWPSAADGEGYSLVLRRPSAQPLSSEPHQWRASVRVGGTPVGSDSSRFSGSPTADLDGNGQIDLIDYAFGNVSGSRSAGLTATTELLTVGEGTRAHLVVSIPRNLAADDVDILIETAPALNGPWQSQPHAFALLRESRLSEGVVVQSFLAPLAGSAAFVRLSVQQLAAGVALP